MSAHSVGYKETVIPRRRLQEPVLARGGQGIGEPCTMASPSPAQPTKRTLDRLRAEGHHAARVEYWQATPFSSVRPGVRIDLFNFADVIAFRSPRRFDPTLTLAEPILLVQATSGSNTSSRVSKILDNAIARDWVRAGHRIEVWGWRKVLVKRGGKAKVWKPRIQVIRLQDFEGGGA